MTQHALQEHIRFNAPMQMNLELTSRCPLCCPHLHQLIEFCRDHSLVSNVALSGWGIDETSLKNTETRD